MSAKPLNFIRVADGTLLQLQADGSYRPTKSLTDHAALAKFTQDEIDHMAMTDPDHPPLDNAFPSAEPRLTRSFKESVKARVEREPAFREALLAEAVDSLIAGEVEVGKAMLRDFINATMGFEKLSLDVGTPAKSLMRMLSAGGNPTATNLFAVIRQVQQSTGVHLGVAPAPAH